MELRDPKSFLEICFQKHGIADDVRIVQDAWLAFESQRDPSDGLKAVVHLLESIGGYAQYYGFSDNKQHERLLRLLRSVL